MQTEIFGYELTQSQTKIVGKIIDPDCRRLIVSAMTRYGKTRMASLGVLLYILRNEDKNIALIAPTHDQTNILRNYIAETIADYPQLRDLVDAPDQSDISRLKKEASKRRVTFQNGCELRTLTAHGSGDSLMGFGADLIVLDEVCLIDDDVYKSRISRMLGDDPENSKLVELLNPWHRENFAFQHWQSDRFEKIHVDWRDALAEGRTTRDWIEQQREELSKYHFTVLYESHFPEETQEGLFRYSWIQKAKDRDIQLDHYDEIWGLDVAEGGDDYNVLSITHQGGEIVKLIEQLKWDEADTMKTVNRVQKLYEKHDKAPQFIKVDSIGIGKGVCDRLKEMGLPAEEVKVSKKADDPDKYRNLKAETYWNLRDKFEDGYIYFDNISQELENELMQITTDQTAGGKLKIIDPSKSPDHADSLMLSICKSSKNVGVGSTDIQF